MAGIALSTLIVLATISTQDVPQLHETDGLILGTLVESDGAWSTESILQEDGGDGKMLGNAEEKLYSVHSLSPESMDDLSKDLDHLTEVNTKLEKDPDIKDVAKASVSGKKQDSQTTNPKVEKALKDAANAKITAMSLQNKALIAGTLAKKAAAAAAQAPMTQAGQDVVKRAQDKLAEAKLAVDAAKDAMQTLQKLKQKASKVILDAAGGKYAKDTGYAGQGGYFGTALKTAFKNGELTERLKHTKYTDTVIKQIKKKAFKEGHAAGIKKGEVQGEAVGAKKVLPKAVAAAESMIKKTELNKESAKVVDEQAVQDAALKAEATKEAAKVRNSIDSEAKSILGIETNTPGDSEAESEERMEEESDGSSTDVDKAAAEFDADTAGPEEGSGEEGVDFSV